MSVTRQQLQAVSKWANDLADLTAGARPLAEVKTKLAALAPLLAEEFDPGAFCRASLVFVARQCKFFPTFGEACEALSEWRKQNPRHAAIPDFGRRDDWDRKLDRQREEADASWRNATEADIRAKVRALDGHPHRQLCGQMLATALRHHAPRLLGYLPPEFLAENDNRTLVAAE